MLANELSWRTEEEIRAGLLHIWEVMQECVAAGHRHRGRAARRAQGPPPGRPRCTSRCAADGRRPTTRCGPWTGSPSTRWRSTRRTPRAAGWSPRRPTARPASSRRCCTTTGDFVAVRLRRRRGAVPAHRGRDRHAVQGERLDLRRRGRLPGRGRLGLLDGRGRAGRGARRHPGAGGERRRDRHRAQPRADLRPGRRAGADPVHRAQRRGLGQGDHRGPDGACAATAGTTSRWTRRSRPCARPART